VDARTPTVPDAVRAPIADIVAAGGRERLEIAWIPAPPPESEVAMVRQRATVIAALPYAGITQIRFSV